MAQRRQSPPAVTTNVGWRTFLLDQSIEYRYSRPVTNLRQRLRVVPPSAHGPQRRQRWHLNVEGVRSSKTRAFVDSFGNLTIDVTVPQVDDAIEFALESEACASQSQPHETPIDQRYLQPTYLTWPDDNILELAVMVAGRDPASICNQVHQSLSYEWGLTGVRTTASEALRLGRGVCQDYAHVMLALCRMAGLPARYVSGHLSGEGGSHAWVEVLLPHPHRAGTWIAHGWDPTHDRRTNFDYLTVAVGRDYADVAPLSGTYDGEGATNSLIVKKQLNLL